VNIPGDLVAFGEVGLAGEIRRVTGVPRRIAEAERMGFRRAIVPAGSGLMPAAHDREPGSQLRVYEVADIKEAIAAALAG
jgi:DNA repair protein RadA/Sms